MDCMPSLQSGSKPKSSRKMGTSGVGYLLYPGWKFGGANHVRDCVVPINTVPGIQGSPRAPESSSWDTHGDQNSGVIWRGSSGRMLMESSARPQSRHSMVYSWGKEKGGGLEKGGLPQP